MFVTQEKEHVLTKNFTMKIDELYKIITSRKKTMPEKSYVASLFRSGNDRIIQKVGEEATEVIIAAKNNDKKRIIEESGDLLFHLLVLLAANNITPADIFEELKKRNEKKK
jgi:phosphoribosyl-ATP pyrophosphohydrolase